MASIAGAAWWWRAGDETVSSELGRRWPHDWAMLTSWRAEHPGSNVRHRPVPLTLVSPDLAAAVIAGEDAGFFGHGPLDFASIREALSQYFDGRRLRGASTISQQLAKNLYLSDERSLWRKLDEARLAYWLERRLGKRRVLALYLNIIELGDGIFGVESASRYYFGTSAAALDRKQALSLAAAIPSPRIDNPSTQTRTWERRRDIIDERLDAYPWIRERVAQQPSGKSP